MWASQSVGTIALLLVLPSVGRTQSAAGSPPATTANVDQRVDAFVRGEMARQKVPGIGLAVIRRGEVLKLTGYGEANVEHKVPVTPETIFQSGSLGKMFTSALIMLLVEDGKLELDRSIVTYLPNAPEPFKAITVRHLLTHTSGIPDYTDELIDFQKNYSEDELTAAAFKLKLEFPPGSRWNYSNTGYVLLGIIAGKAGGKFYGDQLRERLFTPVGMTTARVISEEDIIPNRAAGYRLTRGELKNQDWVAPRLNTTADGSLYFSLRDLVAWERAVRTRAVLEPESWARVVEPMRLTSGRPYPYGMGWSLDTVGGQPTQGHGGAWQGFKTQLTRYMRDDMTVIVLANAAQANPGLFVDSVAAMYNPTLVKPKPEPIADDNPAITERLKSLLADAATGKLDPAQFAYVRAGFFPNAARAYATMLAELGTPTRITLLNRRQVGDDVISTFVVTYPTRELDALLALAPDGKVAQFGLRPRR
ncbi:MAG: Beta-lactamase [Geminicoccaceae bacterium]|nr:Beta-lactamase [Geminicoccaceae bacterium]